jgi:hypothetical protein
MLRQGSVVRARILDPLGDNPKVRPLVIVTQTHEISPNQPLVAVAITGRFSNPLAADEVPLPHHPAGSAKTGLRKPCVAKCSWVVSLRPEDILEQKGFITTDKLTAILKRINQLQGGIKSEPE